MINTGIISPRILFFWLIQFGAVAAIWPFMPNPTASALMVALIAFSALSLLIGTVTLAILTNVALITSLTQFWLSNGFIKPIIGIALIMFGVTLTGLLAHKIRREETGLTREEFLSWIILGFVTAQVTGLLAFWPVLFMQKALLVTVVFYLFWQMLLLISGNSTKQLVIHFVFVGLAGMVVLGSIIWINFPGLRVF